MTRICTAVLLATLWVAVVGAPVHAQSADVEELLKSYGFQLKQEDGRRVVEVSLQQVLKLALERNLTLQSVRVGENIAQSALESARGRFNPTLTSSADYSRVLSPSFTGTPFATLAGSNGLTLSTTYKKPTDSGLTYSLTYSERRVRTLVESIATDGGDPAATTGSFGDISALTGRLTIPFGQDAGQEFNRIPEKRAETGVTGSKLTTESNVLNLVQLTASTYWDLVASLENLRVQADAVKLSEQLLKDNQQRLAAGVLSPFDVQVTETQLARERQALLTARGDVVRVEDLARALLDLQVIDFSVRPLDKPQVHPVDLDYDKLLQRVYASSADLKQIENRLAANALDLQDARNKERTNLDLGLYYTLQGVKGAPFAGIAGFTKTSLDNYGATLTWTLPLDDVQTAELIRQRTLERQQLQLQLDSAKSDLNVRLQSAMRQISLSKDQVHTAGVARHLAEEQLKNEIERFRVGESTSFQVAQAQQDAASAQVQEILARLGFERNYLQLLVLTGDIYSHYGLEPPSKSKSQAN